MFKIVVFACLLGTLLSAPAQKKQDVNKVVKKRSAEQIVYGNHQNHNPIATGKKSALTDGVAPLNTQQLQPDKLDKKATFKVETDSVPVKPDDQSSEPLVPPVLPQNNDKDNTEEIKDLTKMVLDYKNKPANQNGQASAEEDDQLSSDEASGDEDKLISADKKQGSNSLSLYSYYYPLFSPNRKRRTSSLTSLTAEGMNMNAEEAKRVKRELRLTPHDIDLWARYYNKGKRAADYSADYDDYSPEQIPYSEEVANWPDSSEEEEEEMEEEALDRYLDNAPTIPVEPILDESSEREQEEIKEELDLLRYLYGRPEGTSSVEDDIDYGDSLDVNDEKRSYNTNADVDVEAIVYHGQPGIFIAVPPENDSSEKEKRQLMSFVSGSKRSNNALYPYEDEITTGGRWGAFVPNNKRQATIDDYRRLYRLASALSSRETPEASWEY